MLIAPLLPRRCVESLGLDDAIHLVFDALEVFLNALEDRHHWAISGVEGRGTSGTHTYRSRKVVGSEMSGKNGNVKMTVGIVIQLLTALLQSCEISSLFHKRNHPHQWQVGESRNSIVTMRRFQ